MSLSPERIAAFLDAHAPAALVRVEAVQGSAPRETDAWMLVAAGAMLGTIGGGQLEYMALDAARAMLARGAARERLDIPLGPEIGQCCGGRAVLSAERVDAAIAADLLRDAGAAWEAEPEVIVFGAGHVGRALAEALRPLPVRALLVDSRAEELGQVPGGVETLLTPLPEEAVRRAGPGSAFVVMTHDHALDFLIVREALARGDAAYVGMIGSKSKRASFRSWLRRAGEGDGMDVSELVCPIGAAGRPDKRPEVIAAFVAVEIMQKLLNPQGEPATAENTHGN